MPLAKLPFTPLANADFFAYIVYALGIIDRIIIFTILKIRHMKTHTHPTHTHSYHVGSTASTILLAIGFLALVMMLTFLFTKGMH